MSLPKKHKEIFTDKFGTITQPKYVDLGHSSFFKDASEAEIDRLLSLGINEL